MIKADEEGKKMIDSILETGMRRGAWGVAELNALAVFQQSIELIEEEVKEPDGE